MSMGEAGKLNFFSSLILGHLKDSKPLLVPVREINRKNGDVFSR